MSEKIILHNHNTPKVWNEYINKLTEELICSMFQDWQKMARNIQDPAVPEANLISLSLPKCLEFANGKSTLYIQVSKAVNALVNLNSSLLIYRPLGVLKYSDMHDHNSLVYRKILAYSKLFIFYTDDSMRVRLNFNHIYFSSFYSCQCSFGNITIGSASFTEAYCGQHPHLTVFPPSMLVKILITTVGFIDYDFEMSYMVVDRNITLSKPSSTYAFNYYLVWWNPLTKIFLHSFYIEVKKFEYIGLKIVQSENYYTVVHNGPSSKFRTLQPFNIGVNQSLFVTSAFHCLLNIYTEILTSEFGDILKYSGNSRDITQFISIDVNNTKSSIISFPSKSCTRSTTEICLEILLFRAKIREYLNITVTNISNDGMQNSICAYSGFSAYDANQSNMEEILTNCRSNREFSQSRPIYSSTNSLLIVFYQYTDFSRLVVKALISTTDCSIVYLNIFKLHLLCIGKRLDRHKCIEYLNLTAYNSPLKFDIGCHDTSKNYNFCEFQYLDMWVEKNTCATVQLSYNFKDLASQEILDVHIIRAYVENIGVGPTHEIGMELHYQVDGVFKGKKPFFF